MIRLDDFIRTLGKGHANRAPNATIARRMGLDDLGTNGRAAVLGSRTISGLVLLARENGYPVCTNGGLYLAETTAEIDTCLRIEQRAANKHLRRVEALLRVRS